MTTLVRGPFQPLVQAVFALAVLVLLACTLQNLAVRSSEVLIMDTDGGMPGCPLASQPVCQDWSNDNASGSAPLPGGFSNSAGEDEHFEDRLTSLKRAVQRYVSKESGWNGVTSSITLHCHRSQVVAGTMHRFVAVINGLYAREFRVFEPLPYTGEAPVVQGAEPALPQDLYDTSACQGFLDATIDGSGAAAATN